MAKSVKSVDVHNIDVAKKTAESELLRNLIDKANTLLVTIPRPAGKVTLVPPLAVMCVEQQDSRTKGLVRIEQNGVCHGVGFDGIDIHDLGLRIAECHRRAMLHQAMVNTRAEHLSQTLIGMYELMAPIILDTVMDRVEGLLPQAIRHALENIVESGPEEAKGKE